MILTFVVLGTEEVFLTTYFRFDWFRRCWDRNASYSRPGCNQLSYDKSFVSHYDALRAFIGLETFVKGVTFLMMACRLHLQDMFKKKKVERMYKVLPRLQIVSVMFGAIALGLMLSLAHTFTNNILDNLGLSAIFMMITWPLSIIAFIMYRIAWLREPKLTSTQTVVAYSHTYNVRSNVERRVDVTEMQSPPAYDSIVALPMTNVVMSAVALPASSHVMGYQPHAQMAYSVSPAIPVHQFEEPSKQQTNNQPIIQSIAQPVHQLSLQRYREVCQQNEISDLLALKLRQLEGFDIVIIADDSRSMMTPFQKHVAHDNAYMIQQAAFSPTYRRWDELQSRVSIIVDLISCFSSDGIDLHFLNRVGRRHVVDPNQIMQTFETQPYGSAPINQALQTVLQEKARDMCEKKLLVLIMTDGEPTDAAGQANIPELKETLLQRSVQCHVTFVSCTNDDTVMSYLNGWDQSIPRLSVVADYHSERKKAISIQGPQSQFSRGDWIVKCLLGSIEPTLYASDETRMIDVVDEREPVHMHKH